MQQPLDYDPKLKEIMPELTALFKKHNIGGYVVLCSGTHAEFKFMFETPDWSCVILQENGIRFRSKKEDWPSKEAQDSATEKSVNMIEAVQTVAGKCFVDCGEVMDILKEHIKMERVTPPTFTPHREN